jgi:hypothetical protein
MPIVKAEIYSRLSGTSSAGTLGGWRRVTREDKRTHPLSEFQEESR